MTVALIIQRVDKKKVISTISRNLSSYVFLCVCVCVEKHARHDPRGNREKKKTANILGHKKIEIENKLRSQKRNTEEPEKESSTYKLCVCVFIGRDFSIPLSRKKKKKKRLNSFFQVSRSFVSGLLFISSPRIVAISPCIKAQGTLDPASGHFSPLGQ